MAHSSIASEQKTESKLVADIEPTKNSYQIEMQLKQILNGNH